MDTSTLQSAKPIRKSWTFVLFYHVPTFEVEIFSAVPIRISLLVTSAVENSNIFVLNFEGDFSNMWPCSTLRMRAQRGRRLSSLNTKWLGSNLLQIRTHVLKFERTKKFHGNKFCIHLFAIT